MHWYWIRNISGTLIDLKLLPFQSFYLAKSSLDASGTFSQRLLWFCFCHWNDSPLELFSETSPRFLVGFLLIFEQIKTKISPLILEPSCKELLWLAFVARLSMLCFVQGSSWCRNSLSSRVHWLDRRHNLWRNMRPYGCRLEAQRRLRWRFPGL